MTETPKALPVRGRPATLLTADMIKLIAGAVEQGKTRAEAAAAAGVTHTMVTRWITRGRRFRDVGSAQDVLPSQEWLCLCLVKSVAEAEERREQLLAAEAAAAVGAPLAVGRPPLLTAERVDTVVERLAAGETRTAAASAAGVTGRTLQRWLNRGARATFGTPRTEYERLCAALYGRVKAAEKTAAAEDQGAPEIETKSLEGLGLATGGILSREAVEAFERRWAAADHNRCGPVVVPGTGRLTTKPVDLEKLPDGARVQPLGDLRISASSIAAGEPPKHAGWSDLVDAINSLPAAALPAGSVIDLRPPKGRIRTWLRIVLDYAAQAL